MIKEFIKEFNWYKFKNQMSILFSNPHEIMILLIITTYAIVALNFVIIKESIYETGITYFMRLILYLIIFTKLLSDFYKEEKFFLSLGYTRKNFYYNNAMFIFIYSLCYAIITILWVCFIKEDIKSFTTEENKILNCTLISFVIFIVNILLAYICCMQLVIRKTVNKWGVNWGAIAIMMVVINKLDRVEFVNQALVMIGVVVIIVLNMRLEYKKARDFFFERDV